MVSVFDRYRACFVDAFITTILWMVTLYLISLPVPILFIVLYLVDLFYFVCFEQSGWQATPGKRLYNMKVTDDSNNKPSFARSLIRYIIFASPSMIWTWMHNGLFKELFDNPLLVANLAYLFIPYFLMFLLVSHVVKLILCITMLGTPEKLTVYDMLTKTRVRSNEISKL